MDKINIVKEWLDFASKDISSAKYLLDMRPVPLEIICYHCEQAAEKI
ncbi:MAG: HEPN domain-containing protein [Desulfosporosinus sp.]|nr:HEPN domain-containing protein [Desulfosporosinus sp.]